MNVCMYVCMYVYMYVCMYVYCLQTVFFRGLHSSLRKELWPYLLGLIDFEITVRQKKEKSKQNQDVYKQINYKRYLTSIDVVMVTYHVHVHIHVHITHTCTCMYYMYVHITHMFTHVHVCT